MAELERRTDADRARRERRRARSKEWTVAGARPATNEDSLAATGSSRASEWAKLRADTPLTLTGDDLVAAEIAQRSDLARRGRARSTCRCRACSLFTLRRRRACIEATRASSAPTTARRRSSSASPARSRSANRRRRASCAPCSRAGRTRRRSSSSPPTASSCPTRC